MAEPFSQEFPILTGQKESEVKLLFFDRVFGTDANFRCYQSATDGIVFEFYLTGNNKTPFKVLRSQNLVSYFDGLDKLKVSGYFANPQSPKDTMTIALAGINQSQEVFVSYGGFKFTDPDQTQGGLVYLSDKQGRRLKFLQIELLHYSPKSGQAGDWFTLLGIDAGNSVLQYKINPSYPGGIMSQQLYATSCDYFTPFSAISSLSSRRYNGILCLSEKYVPNCVAYMDDDGSQAILRLGPIMDWIIEELG